VSGRRELTVAVVGTAIGAGLVLFAASRVWLAAVELRPTPLPPEEITRTGGSLVPVLPALGLVALACAGGLVATGGLARRLVGLVLGVAAILMVARVVPVLASRDVAVGWPIASLLGAALVGAAGTAAVMRGGGWAVMGSRYGRTPMGRSRTPAARSGPVEAAASETALWDALDRGDDPTRDGAASEEPTRGDPDPPPHAP
jgi:hypothetical protein